MQYEKSCGFVAYKDEGGERRYLIICSLDGEYGFPKGHVEGNETEHETAMRELKEETNAEVTIVPGFRRQIEYAFPNKPGVMKQTVYFLGKCTADDILCRPGEVAGAEFAPYDRAMELLSFEDTRNVLKGADVFLRSIAVQ
ncbi:MAG: NUDIX domain-containing protein [Clostridia bacterium]|nr:NUDIX domain-containing protein [Clostridia bacterium]MBQ4086571.1 NUDIX domain-containing protein [Clostridia bacterium]